MEITIPAVKEEAEKWVRENLSKYLLITYYFNEGHGVKVALDPAFGRALNVHMDGWAKDVKLVAREEQ